MSIKTEEPMQSRSFNYSSLRLLLPALLFLVSSGFYSAQTVNAQPNISLRGSVAPGTIARGRTARATVEMDIPGGYHVHSNRPLEKFLIATELRLDSPKGIRVGAVSYPRALMRNLKFSKNRVAVFEGRVTMRFNITVPQNFASGTVEIKAKVRYQSCDDEVCFPPQTREEKMWLKIE
jgi:DsbC/DsbD-like thiol-disulfide interchange protein